MVKGLGINTRTTLNCLYNLESNHFATWFPITGPVYWPAEYLAQVMTGQDLPDLSDIKRTKKSLERLTQAGKVREVTGKSPGTSDLKIAYRISHEEFSRRCQAV